MHCRRHGVQYFRTDCSNVSARPARSVVEEGGELGGLGAVRRAAHNALVCVFLGGRVLEFDRHTNSVRYATLESGFESIYRPI